MQWVREKAPLPGRGPDRWGEIRLCGRLPVSVVHVLPLGFEEVISIQKNLQVFLLRLFFFYLLNIHINEYVLFIDVFGFRNIELEK